MPPSSQASAEDPVWPIVLAVLGLSLALAVSKILADDFRRATAVAAWMHVWPLAWTGSQAHWTKDIPVLGPLLLEPSILAEAILRTAWSRGIDPADWLLGQAVAARAAMVVYGPVLIFLARRARAGRPDIAFRRVHSLESLIDAQSASWPEVGIVRHIESLDCRTNPDVRIARQRAEQGSMRAQRMPSLALGRAIPAISPPALEIALRPETWLRAEGLSTRLDQAEQQHSPSAADVGGLSNEWDHLTIDAVCEALEDRLGPPWRGFETMRPIHRGLAAVFACHLDFRTNDGRELLASLAVMAERAAAGKRQFDGAICADRRIAHLIAEALSGQSGAALLQVACRHAWLRTAMMGMLQAARRDRGVIAAASFVWLKREDRELWYALNACGNAVAAAEAAAVCSHFRAERQFRQPLRKPAVFQASRSLIRDYLDLENPRLPQRRATAEERRPVGDRLAEAAAEASAASFADPDGQCKQEGLS